MSYRTGESLQRYGKFQNRECKLCKGAGEITLKREKMYAKIRYQNMTVKEQNESMN